MASITITTNLSGVMAEIKRQLETVRSKEYLLRPVAQEQIRLMHRRIHEEGKASDGMEIGKYSEGYMKIREEKYNRKPDKKVIISLTRQLENDYAVIDTPAGYGVGFNNKFNFDKSKWVQENYGKKIFDMTPKELQAAIDFINELTDQALENNP